MFILNLLLLVLELSLIVLIPRNVLQHINLTTLLVGFFLTITEFNLLSIDIYV